MTDEFLRELERDFQNLTPHEQKEYVLGLQLLEQDGVVAAGLSRHFLALLEPEHDEQ